MKLLPILLLAFVLSLGIACGEPSFEDAIATRVAETNIAATPRNVLPR